MGVAAAQMKPMIIRSSRTALSSLFFVAASTAGFASLGGCEATGTPTASSVAEHNEGELVHTNDPHVWAEASEADFGKGMGKLGGESDKPIPKADPTTVRLQQWLDRYHTIVGDVMRERGEQLVAPKPTAAAFKVWGPNAWVSTTFACTSWNVRVSNGPRADHVFITPNYAMPADVADECITPINWTNAVAFATFFNSQSHACKLNVSGNDLTVSRCDAYGSTGPLATIATSSTIGVTLDAITWGDEIRVVATLAHELGHYYRAHANPNVRKNIDFFYRDTPNGPDRPLPDAESRTYEKVIDQIQSAPRAVRLKPTTKYSKRLASVLYDLRALCPSAQMSDLNMRSIMNGQITPSNTSMYLSFEDAFASCGKTLALDATTGDTLGRALRAARLNHWFDPTAPTLDAALTAISVKLDEVDREEAALVERMTEGQFGWYTDEQEADELGLELATRAGFKPADVINASVRTYEQLDALYKRGGVDRGDEITMDRCKQWLADGFTEKAADGTNKAVRVPIGSLSDSHHEGCYRVYNLWRESKRHDYVVAEPLPELTPAWSEIQMRAASLGGTRPPALDVGEVEPTDSEDTDGTDPEDEAPPPRRKKKPSVVPGADAGAPATMTVVREGGCSAAPRSSTSGLLALGSLGLVGLLIARRRRS